MTIGPLPMMQDRLEVGALGHSAAAFPARAGHEVGELVEEVARRRAGPGPASGWCWTLNAGTSRTRKPSTMPSLRFTWVTSAPPGDVSACDDVVVVLARDLDPAGRLVAHRVVRAVVAERQLVGLRAEREPDDLVAEADAEHGHLAEQRRATASAAPVDRGRVTRPVREEHAVGLAGEDLGGGRRRRDDLDPATRRRRGGAGSCA